jgi:hypothetical protein
MIVFSLSGQASTGDRLELDVLTAVGLDTLRKG